jgi:hypothetical protein
MAYLNMIIIKNNLYEGSSLRLTESKSTLKNINYYHGSRINGIKSLGKGQEYSTPDKNAIEADIVWITPSIGYAFLFTEDVGTIYKVKPVKSLDIFDAGVDKDWENLMGFEGVLNNRKDFDRILDDIIKKRKFKRFREIMAKGDWSDLFDISGLKRSDWINIVIKLGYDGYQDHEALEDLKSTTTIGVFNPSNLKIVGGISGPLLAQIGKLIGKNPNRALELNDINDL